MQTHARHRQKPAQKPFKGNFTAASGSAGQSLSPRSEVENRPAGVNGTAEGLLAADGAGVLGVPGGSPWYNLVAQLPRHVGIAVAQMPPVWRGRRACNQSPCSASCRCPPWGLPLSIFAKVHTYPMWHYDKCVIGVNFHKVWKLKS